MNDYFHANQSLRVVDRMAVGTMEGGRKCYLPMAVHASNLLI